MTNLFNGTNLLDEGLHILNNKDNVEFKLDEIAKSVSFFILQLETYLHIYEKLHVFSNRHEKFPNILEEISEGAEKVVSYSKQICETISSHLVNAFNFLLVFQAISESGAHTNDRSVAHLLNVESYTNKFNTYLEIFRNMELSVYQKFTIIVDSQPPPVIQTGRLYPISLRFFNLHNAFQGRFTIKVYLVRASTVNDIRSRNEIPASITAISRPQSNDNGGRRKGGVVPGKIFLKEIISKEDDGRKQTRHRTSSSEDTIQSTPGYSVELLEGEWVQGSRMKSQSFERNLAVKQIEAKENNKFANAKVALLFVAEFHPGQQNMWAVSSPMVVITHGSQNERGWGIMAWDEMVSKQRRLDFEVEPSANWYRVREMLKGTFECLVGKSLTQSHVEYLERKAERTMLGGNIKIMDDTVISKTALFNNGQNISFWSWFYRTTSMMRIGGNFNEIWEKGYIHGFIEDQDARALLNEGLTNCTDQSGTFIIKFSDSRPGSLTFIFIGIDHQIYKMEPLEIRKKKAIEECTTFLLRYLNTRERQNCREVFTHIYPNIPKRIAFEKFYEWADDNPSPAYEEKGYVTLCNFVPLSSQLAIPPLNHQQGS